MSDPATSLAAPTVAAVATTAIATALSAWGSYAIVLIVLGWMLWRSQAEKTLLKEENAALRTEVRDLHNQRLEDAKQLMRVTESSTALTTVRAHGDEAFQSTFKDMAMTIGEMKAQIALLAPRARASR